MTSVERRHSMHTPIQEKIRRSRQQEGSDRFHKVRGVDFSRLKSLLRMATTLTQAEGYFYLYPSGEYHLVVSENCHAGTITRLEEQLDRVFNDTIIAIIPEQYQIDPLLTGFSRMIVIPVFDVMNSVTGMIGLLKSKDTFIHSELRDHLRTISHQVTDLYLSAMRKEHLFREQKARKIAEKKIREIENILRYTNENSPIGIIQTNVNGELITSNALFESLTGRSINEGVSMRWYETILEEELEQVKTTWEKQAGQISVFQLQCRFADHGQGIRTAVVHGTPIVTIDGSVKYLLFLTDITQKLFEEEKAKQIQQRELQMIRQKERFIANMSHEIRTPMNAIIGFTEILLKNGVDKHQQEYVEIIRSAGENLLSIINNILDFSKIESGGIRSIGSEFSIMELRRSVYDLLKLKAQEKNISFFFLIDENIPQRLTGDLIHLNQVMINLTNNAIKFTEKGYVAVDISLLENGDQSCSVEFRIKDTGPGISREMQDFIFERFFQTDSAMIKNQMGTGLGLSISKSLVEQMGGEIRLISEEGNGAEFIFTLNFGKPSTMPAIAQSATSITFSQPGDIKILVFEDNELNKQLLRHLINEYGFEVDLVENGVAGLQYLRQKSYDLILMDLDMPVMDGYHATEEIRNNLGIATPIVAMTAHIISGEKEKCLSLGMNDFIPKPIQKRQLIEMVHRFTEGKTQQVKEEEPPQDGLNLGYLKSLSNSNQLFEREMIEVFVRTAPRKIQLLRQHIIAGDATQIRKLTHHLKGSLQIIGLNKVMRFIEEIDALSEFPERKNELHLFCDHLNEEVNHYCLLLRDLLQEEYHVNIIETVV